MSQPGGWMCFGRVPAKLPRPPHAHMHKEEHPPPQRASCVDRPPPGWTPDSPESPVGVQISWQQTSHTDAMGHQRVWRRSVAWTTSSLATVTAGRGRLVLRGPPGGDASRGRVQHPSGCILSFLWDSPGGDV